MGFFFGWLVLSAIVGAIGGERKIGVAGAFFVSLFLSPLIGLIITISSPRKEDEKIKEESLNLQRQQVETLSSIKNNGSIADELIKLSELKDKGILTLEEFEIQKQKILNSNQ